MDRAGAEELLGQAAAGDPRALATVQTLAGANANSSNKVAADVKTALSHRHVHSI